MKSKFTLYVFFPLILLFSCSKSDKTFTIETKDGVNYVHNHAPLWGDNPKVALEFIQKIGELEAEDENYLLYRPRDIIKDAQGNLYILDAGNYRIQKYDPNGKFLATFGRRGQGPSEFQIPFSIRLDNADNLLVGEFDSNIIMVLDQNGREIRRIRLESFYFMNIRGGFLFSQSGKIIAPDIHDSTIVSVFNSNGKLLQRFGEKRIYKDPSSIGNAFYFTNDKQDNIYLVFYIQNRIEKYSPDSKLIIRADRKLNYKETKEIRRETRVIEGLERPAIEVYNLISSGIGLDNKERLWTVTYIRQLDNSKKQIASDLKQFEIFDTNGILLGYLPLPEKYTSTYRIFGDRMYFVESQNEMCIYEYKIVEK